MKIPLVLIVGRPNVGKSTLFNRLTQSTTAIVDDVSGVTRDRIYGDVDWNGRHFQVIDTGGYVPNSEDLFETAIREQVEIALDECDAVFFVVDGRTGLLPIDKEITNILRKSNRHSYILVNKSDTPEFANTKSDFYSLGLEHVYDISALNGRNLGNLLDDLMGHIEFADEKDVVDSRLHLAIIGKPNVGKSSLVNSLLGYDRSIVTDIPGTTRDSVDSIMKYYGEEIVLVDTAGLRKKTKIKENIEFFSMSGHNKALWNCDVAVLLLDSKLGVENQDQKMNSGSSKEKKGLILAVNKWDLIEKETNTAKAYADSIYAKLGSIDYVPVIFISALTKQRIFKLIEIARTVYTERGKKVPTNQLNEILLPEIEKTPPPASPTGKEVKIKYITQVGEHYPIFMFFANDLNSFPITTNDFWRK